eukprot:TRINITY_DN60578_c0_g1_i1.p1 TRINITY_DN60578_c0_g1~~TRINITY_DN60578_c0_g1_i1.p1  ORF type:complete len:1942 (+),score=587.06 TRINITY_DN60578_c0_g1_i1:112-5937(+)
MPGVDTTGLERGLAEAVGSAAATLIKELAARRGLGLNDLTECPPVFVRSLWEEWQLPIRTNLTVTTAQCCLLWKRFNLWAQGRHQGALQRVLVGIRLRPAGDSNAGVISMRRAEPANVGALASVVIAAGTASERAARAAATQMRRLLRRHQCALSAVTVAAATAAEVAARRGIIAAMLRKRASIRQSTSAAAPIAACTVLAAAAERCSRVRALQEAAARRAAQLKEAQDEPEEAEGVTANTGVSVEAAAEVEPASGRGMQACLEMDTDSDPSVESQDISDTEDGGEEGIAIGGLQLSMPNASRKRVENQERRLAPDGQTYREKKFAAKFGWAAWNKATTALGNDQRVPKGFKEKAEVVVVSEAERLAAQAEIAEAQAAAGKGATASAMDCPRRKGWEELCVKLSEQIEQIEHRAGARGPVSPFPETLEVGTLPKDLSKTKTAPDGELLPLEQHVDGLFTAHKSVVTLPVRERMAQLSAARTQAWGWNAAQLQRAEVWGLHCSARGMTYRMSIVGPYRAPPVRKGQLVGVFTAPRSAAPAAAAAHERQLIGWGVVVGPPRNTDPERAVFRETRILDVRLDWIPCGTLTAAAIIAVAAAAAGGLAGSKAKPDTSGERPDKDGLMVPYEKFQEENKEDPLGAWVAALIPVGTSVEVADGDGEKAEWHSGVVISADFRVSLDDEGLTEEEQQELQIGKPRAWKRIRREKEKADDEKIEARKKRVAKFAEKSKSTTPPPKSAAARSGLPHCEVGTCGIGVSSALQRPYMMIWRLAANSPWQNETFPTEAEARAAYDKLPEDSLRAILNPGAGARQGGKGSMMGKGDTLQESDTLCRSKPPEEGAEGGDLLAATLMQQIRLRGTGPAWLPHVELLVLTGLDWDVHCASLNALKQCEPCYTPIISHLLRVDLQAAPSTDVFDLRSLFRVARGTRAKLMAVPSEELVKWRAEESDLDGVQLCTVLDALARPISFVRGAAGTGKTHLAAAIIRVLRDSRWGAPSSAPPSEALTEAVAAAAVSATVGVVRAALNVEEWASAAHHAAPVRPADSGRACPDGILAACRLQRDRLLAKMAGKRAPKSGEVCKKCFQPGHSADICGVAGAESLMTAVPSLEAAHKRSDDFGAPDAAELLASNGIYGAADEAPILYVCSRDSQLDAALERFIEFEQRVVRIGSHASDPHVKGCDLGWAAAETFAQLSTDHPLRGDYARARERQIAATAALHLALGARCGNGHAHFSQGVWLTPPQIWDEDEELAQPEQDQEWLEQLSRGQPPWIDNQTLGLVRRANELTRLPAAGQCSQELRAALDEYKAASEQRKAARDALMLHILGNAVVVAATVSGALLNTGLIHRLGIKTVIVDEASEVPEARLFGLLPASTERLVLLCDDRQVTRVPLLAQNVARTDPRQMPTALRLVSATGPQCPWTAYLNTQHRLRGEGSTLAMQLYHPAQIAHPPVSKSEYHVLYGSAQMVIHAEAEMQDANSHYNQHESYFAVEICRYLCLQCGVHPSRIAILVPNGFFAQLMFMRYGCQQQGLWCPVPGVPSVWIDFVDSFQGREADYVLVSLVRSPPPRKAYKGGWIPTDTPYIFEEDRIVQMLTRARTALILLGNLTSLAQCNQMWQWVHSQINSTLAQCTRSVGLAIRNPSALRAWSPRYKNHCDCRGAEDVKNLLFCFKDPAAAASTAAAVMAVLLAAAYVPGDGVLVRDDDEGNWNSGVIIAADLTVALDTVGLTEDEIQELKANTPKTWAQMRRELETPDQDTRDAREQKLKDAGVIQVLDPAVIAAGVAAAANSPTSMGRPSGRGRGSVATAPVPVTPAPVPSGRGRGAPAVLSTKVLPTKPDADKKRPADSAAPDAKRAKAGEADSKDAGKSKEDGKEEGKVEGEKEQDDKADTDKAAESNGKGKNKTEDAQSKDSKDADSAGSKRKRSKSPERTKPAGRGRGRGRGA